MILTVEESNIIYGVLREAEQKIAEHIGKCVKLRFNIAKERGNPSDLLRVVAGALGYDNEDFRNKSRRPEYVMLRRVGAYLLRYNFPSLSLKSIGDFFGQDHTTINNTLAAAKNAFQTDDQEFIGLFSTAQQAVSDWLNQ